MYSLYSIGNNIKYISYKLQKNCIFRKPTKNK